MAEIDDLLDSLIIQNKASDVSYVDDKYANTFKLKETPAGGQGLFAERNLSINDPVCSLSYPIIAAIDSDFLHSTCYHCLVVTAAQLPLPSWGHATIKLQTCNGCHLARFCNKDCQVKGWHAFHKYECKILKRLRDNVPPAILRAVMRIVLLKDRSILSDEQWTRTISLNSHEQIMTARGRSNLTDMAITIKHLTGSDMSFEMIQRLIFIIKFNASELPTLIYGAIGVMLDPIVGKINHSCEPNIALRRPQHTTTSGWMNSSLLSEDQRNTFAQIVPLRDIKEGEELFNCYVAPTVSVQARKAKLMEDYLFECRCSRCTSDTQAAAELAANQPDIFGQFGQWTKNMIRHLSRSRNDIHAFRKAAAEMDKSERYLKYPVLYTTGDYPQIAMELASEGLKVNTLDESFVNLIRISFLVNPLRFVGRHNPTNIYTIFLILDIFDVLLGLATTNTIAAEKVEKCLQSLEARGLRRNGLIYWRNQLCVDLRKRLENTAARDLLSLVEKREEQMLQCAKEEQDVDENDAIKQMGGAMKVKEPTWTIMLQQAGT